MSLVREAAQHCQVTGLDGGSGGGCPSEKNDSKSSREGEPGRDSTHIAWRSVSKSMRRARRRMAGTRHDGQPVFEERSWPALAPRRRQRPEMNDVAAAAGGERFVRARSSPHAVACEQRCDRAGRSAAQRQGAYVDAALKAYSARRQVGHDVAQLRQHALSGAPSAAGAGTSAGRPFEQGRAEPRLEVLDRSADRRLRDELGATATCSASTRLAIPRAAIRSGSTKSPGRLMTIGRILRPRGLPRVIELAFDAWPD